MRKKIFYVLAILCCSLAYGKAEKPLYFSDDIVYLEEDGIEERKGIYTLNIKGIPVNYAYELIKEDGKYYFPVISFFQSIGMKNYKKEGNIIKFFLGNDLKEYKIDPSKNPKTDYILEDGDVYLLEEKFKEYFAQRIAIENSKLAIQIIPSFSTPEDIRFILDTTSDRLKKEAEIPVLTYKTEKELIDLGNLRVNLQGTIINGKSDSKKNDWSGFLEYSSPFLYGTLLSEYDLKDHKFGDITLRYDDIYQGNYDLEFGIYGANREKGLSFKKDRGYYEEGKDYVITEKVPLGSRVELLFGGIPIDIAYEENGQVTFMNNLIKSGRTYNLKIYSPDGIISEREIKITDDYNQQNKGEFGYDIFLREDKDASSLNSDINIFYGVTNHLTLGAGYSESHESIEEVYFTHKDLKGQIIYSNFLFNNAYTLKLEGEKSISEDDRFSKKYSHSILLDTDIIQDLNLKIEQRNNGAYYDEKNEQYLQLQYDITENVTLNYDYEKIELYDNGIERDYSYGIQMDQSWKSILVSLEGTNNRKQEREYTADIYYTGFEYIITKMSNKIDGAGNYEGSLKIMNKSWNDTLEYSFETSYSSKKKDIYTLDFKVKLDNWFEIGTYLEKNGENRGYMGIDKVIDLKNPTAKVENLDSSRLEVASFIDCNNNNKLDQGEEFTGNVEITLGEKTVTTDKNGVAKFYGIPSNAEYDLEINSLRPTLNAKKTKVRVRGTGTGTIRAYVPVKPQVELNGFVDLKTKTLNENQRVDIYSNTFITVINEKDNYKKCFYPDTDGTFYLTDILPGIYNVEINYEGEDYRFKILNQNIELIYGKNMGQNDVTFTMEVE